MFTGGHFGRKITHLLTDCAIQVWYVYLPSAKIVICHKNIVRVYVFTESLIAFIS